MYETVTHSGFDFNFLMVNDTACLQKLIDHFYILFGEMSIQVFVHILIVFYFELHEFFIYSGCYIFIRYMI